VFNLLVANNDNHLKNLSFMVSAEGIEMSPAYDLLSTTFGEVTRESVLRAGEALGLARRICERELNRLVLALPSALDRLARDIAIENAQYSESVRPFLAGEIRLIDTIRHLVVPEMVRRVARA
jgi:serine/threonine-protein kinase HipA